MRINARLTICATLLGVSIIFGGGGSPSPMTELVVELSAIVAIVAWVWLVRSGDHYPVIRTDRGVMILAVCFALIPALQLVPLPPSIWHALPGRTVEVQSLALVDASSAWMPWSLSPTRTFASLLSLIPPLVMLFMVSRLTVRDRAKLLGFLGGLGIVAAVVGAVQLASGNANFLRFYARTQYGFATGFQANHNADADVLLIAAMGLAAWAFSTRRIRGSRQAQLLIWSLLTMLGLSVVLTGSRAGVALGLVAAPICILIAFPNVRFRNRRTAAIVATALVLVGGGGFLASNNARIQRTLDRFGHEEAVRPEIWQDTWYAIGQHWPVGSGVGTFEPIFSAAERLEYVRPTYSNRAHDDYLEFMLEAGIVAPLFVAAVFAFAGVRIWKILRSKRSHRYHSQGLLVLGGLLVLVLHSLVDYPMRTLSLAVVAGLLAGLLSRSEPSGVERASGSVEGVAG